MCRRDVTSGNHRQIHRNPRGKQERQDSREDTEDFFLKQVFMEPRLALISQLIFLPLPPEFWDSMQATATPGLGI